MPFGGRKYLKPNSQGTYQRQSESFKGKWGSSVKSSNVMQGKPKMMDRFKKGFGEGMLKVMSKVPGLRQGINRANAIRESKY